MTRSERVIQESCHACNDGAIGQIEDIPGKIEDVEIDEVDDGAVNNAVDEIADGAADDQRQTGLDQPAKLESAAPAENLSEQIVALLGPTPVAVDELARLSGHSAREVRLALLELEIDGMIRRHAGDRITRS